MRFQTKQTSMIQGMIVALLLGAGAHVNAQAIVDGFGDADRDNDATTDGGASVTDPGDVGVRWYLARGTSGITLGVEDDTAGIGSLTVLNVFTLSSSTRALSAAIEEVTLANPGDSISMASDLRLVGSLPSDPTS